MRGILGSDPLGLSGHGTEVALGAERSAIVETSERIEGGFDRAAAGESALDFASEEIGRVRDLAAVELGESAVAGGISRDLF